MDYTINIYNPNIKTIFTSNYTITFIYLIFFSNVYSLILSYILPNFYFIF